METLNNIVLTIQHYLADYILIIALLLGGLWFSIRLGFIQVRGFGEGMRRTFGGLFHKKGEAGADGMSSFQALATAIAAQVGTGYSAGGRRPGSHLLDVDRGFPWNGYDLRRGHHGTEV